MRLFAAASVVLWMVGCSSGDDERQAFQEGLAKAASEHDGSPSTSGQVAGLEPTCKAVSHPKAEPVTTAKKIVDAIQQGDQAAVCANIGRRDVPDGLLRYADALEQGLPKEITLVEASPQPESNQVLLRFKIPDEDSTTVLGFAFQKQADGWVLLMAPFLP